MTERRHEMHVSVMHSHILLQCEEELLSCDTWPEECPVCGADLST